jgi:hypothetical protein
MLLTYLTVSAHFPGVQGTLEAQSLVQLYMKTERAGPSGEAVNPLSLSIQTQSDSKKACVPSPASHGPVSCGGGGR